MDHFSEMMNSDIAACSMHLESHDSRLERLEQQMDYFESESKKNNLRIFGLPEDNNEDNDILKYKITNDILKVAYPEDSVPNDCIEFTKRIGNKGNFKSRMVLVKFKSFDIKSAIFGARDSLRGKGLRVSSDLTTYQRSELRKLSKSGRKGYFKNGRLVVLPNEEVQHTNHSSRTYKRQRLGDKSEISVDDASNEPSDNMVI
ncbi:hypothetical protein ACF0H5_006470 [Mactra antiquata]